MGDFAPDAAEAAPDVPIPWTGDPAWQARFQAQLLDSVRQAVIATDLAGTVTYWNAAAEQLYGWQAWEAIGRSVHELTVPEMAAGQAEDIMAAVTSGQTWSGEFTVRRRDGSTFPALVTDTPIADEEGEIIGVVGVSTDLTDARAVERRYRALHERGWDAAAVVDADGTILYVTPEAERALGCPAELIVGTNGARYVHPEDLPIGSEAILQAFAREEAATVCWRVRWSEEDPWRWVEQTIADLRSDPAVGGIVTNLRDITATREAEEAARVSEERFRRMFAESPIGKAVVDCKLRLVDVNDALCRMLGYERDELLGRSIDEITHPDDVDADVEQALRLVAGEIDAYQLEKRYIRRDGTEVIGRLTGWVMRDAEGAFQYGVGAVEDVTSQVRALELLGESQRRLRMALDAAGMVTWTFDAEAAVVELSANATELWALATAALPYDALLSLVHPDDRRLLDLDRLAGDLAEGDEFVADFRVLFPDGQRWLHARGRIERGETAEETRIIGTAMDVTAEREAQEKRLEAEAVFRRTIDASSDAFIGIDGNGCITDWNDAAEHLFGWRANEAVGQDAVDLLVADGVAALVREHQTAQLAAGEATSRVPQEMELRNRSGGLIPVEATFTVLDVNGTHVMRMFVRDISRRKAIEEQLIAHALTDALTGLPNRALLGDRLAGALARRQGRHGGLVGVLLLDLDRFKVVNDSLGHDVGDELLVVVAERIAAAVRPADTVARFGGDEFVVVAENLATPNAVLALARQVRAAVSVPVELRSHELVPTASIGVAIAATEATTADSLIRDADLAMYRAKQQGGDQVEVFDGAMRTRALARLEMEAELRAAIENQDLSVHYQPLVDFGGEVSGVEALVRWAHPRRGLVHPAEFITLAEETGLVVPLGELVLRAACRQAASWRRSVAPELTVSVNISARQLTHPSLVPSVLGVLEEVGLDPAALCLEITETALMADTGSVAHTLNLLSEAGVRIAVDDFGTGYSSLLYLRRFPVHVLKLDRFFVAGLGVSAQDAAIVGSVIGLAHALGMRSVAEGVETAGQLAELSRLGCDLAQGYYFSRPAPAEEIERRLAGGAPAWPVLGTAEVATNGTRSRHAPRNSPRHRILLVDDSPGDRSLLRHALDAHDELAVVGEAEDAEAALAAAARFSPDIILLDLALPGRDGVEILPELRAAAPGARVVLLSSFMSQGVRHAAVAAGASDCLDKNVSVPGLVEALLAVADGHGSSYVATPPPLT